MTRPWTPAAAEAAPLPAPLELPSPLDLPAEIALSPAAAAAMRARLGEALAALADPDPAARLARLSYALLWPPRSLPAAEEEPSPLWTNCVVLPPSMAALAASNAKSKLLS